MASGIREARDATRAVVVSPRPAGPGRARAKYGEQIVDAVRCGAVVACVRNGGRKTRETSTRSRCI